MRITRTRWDDKSVTRISSNVPLRGIGYACEIGRVKEAETTTIVDGAGYVRETISRRSCRAPTNRVIRVRGSRAGYQLPVSTSGLLVRSSPTTFSRLRVGRSPRASLTYDRRYDDYLSSVYYCCVIANARIETSRSRPLCHLFFTRCPPISRNSRTRERGWKSG